MHRLCLAVAIAAMAWPLIQAHDAGAAPVVVTGSEIWDGANNPHSAQGVVRTGTGTVGDPYVFTIPNGMTINSGGAIRFDVNAGDAMGTTLAPNVRLAFANGGGGLTLNSGGAIDLSLGHRTFVGGTNNLQLLMNNNSISGLGNFINSQSASSPLHLDISSSLGGNIAFGNINAIRNDSFRSNVTINAGGVVSINSINVQDLSAGGEPSGNVTVRGLGINLGGINAFSSRADAGPSGANGTVLLEALAPMGFNPNDPLANSLANMLSLSGLIDVNGNATNQLGGDVTLRAVVLDLNPGFNIDREGDSLLGLFAGDPLYTGDSLSSLFMNDSGFSFSAVHNVQYGLVQLAPEPSSMVLFGGMLVAMVGMVWQRRRS